MAGKNSQKYPFGIKTMPKGDNICFWSPFTRHDGTQGFIKIRLLSRRPEEPAATVENVQPVQTSTPPNTVLQGWKPKSKL